MTRLYLSSILLTILCSFSQYCYCEPKGNVYSAISHMEPLIDIERRLVKIAREYLNQERHQLNGLKQFADSVEEAMNLSKDDPMKYLGNPINSYLIIKRFTSGWSDLGDRLSVDDKKLEDVKVLLKSNEMYMPTFEKDMIGATDAILRLQDTYDITAKEISDGIVEGTTKSSHVLTAQDCLDIASRSHQEKRYVRTMEWLKEAERIFHDPYLQHRRGNATALEINEFLAWTYYLANDMEEALRYTNLVLQEDPTNEKVLQNQKIYSWYVSRKRKSPENEATYMKKAQEVLDAFVNLQYVKACRDTKPKLLKIKNHNHLVCFYKRNAPTLTLKPLKVTRMHDNPEVYIFHDLLQENEMKELRRIATPRLMNAQVVNTETNEIGDYVEADYRIAKTMFLNEMFPSDKKISNKLDQRFGEVTELNMKYSEELQMNNYGLGGQYEFHHDHGLPGQGLANHPDGNRIATLLCYLSDVERGGETVFTQIGLSVPPKKGDAVFWYNLYRNGTGIQDTEHASCPVVSGSKWVANKWIHEHGNEFKRKCLLNRYE
ncbi:prolyl 4-hydroxylase subunit alpha-1-like isoform X1 [Hydractinia symbiolongicarpus]|uniref:prolyl 4-hydroxylase subunit alpha-1-like isoform X1 n=1 Tax=Hydractinia symbiolongicarpus TaxID=13093 RepID=UPI00254F238A|nr:prolyl 4-hydroxylase subunit alpha-1-like isoform X1 [Hydractinia symbiolongicarpus]